MADQKISELLSGGLPQAGDMFLIARSGDNYRIDGGVLATTDDIQGLVTEIDSIDVVANRADGKAAAANTLAGSALDQANTATAAASAASSAASTASSLAGSAYAQANAATSTAITASSLAGSAYNQANTATSSASTASSLAGSAYNQANTALSMAQNATSVATKLNPPAVYLSGAPNSIQMPYMMHPNSIPMSTWSASFPVAANTVMTWASCFYTGQNLAITSFEMQVSVASGGARSLNWQLWSIDPSELKLVSARYTGRDTLTNGVGRVEDRVDGVLAPGWYAVTLSVGLGSGALQMYGFPAFAQYVNAYVVSSTPTPPTGFFELGTNYYPANSASLKTAVWRTDNRPYQIPFTWYYTNNPPRAFTSVIDAD